MQLKNWNQRIERKIYYVDLLSKRKVLILKIQDNGMGISKNIIADISMGKYYIKQ